MPKISLLPPSPGLSTDDLYAVVDDPSGVPVTQKATIAQLITLLDLVYVKKAGDTMTGPLLFSADNTIDIGASGATRPRTGYFGTSMVTALVASPAATALSFASAGTTRANFSTAGNLLFNTDAANDIGASGSNRPANVWAATSVRSAQVHGISLYAHDGVLTSATGFVVFPPSDGVVTFYNGGLTGFGRFQLGGTTNGFPAMKRSGTILQAVLADDSGFATYQGILQVAVNATAAAPPVTTHTIPITDAAGQVYRVPCLV